jgi:hypothetical protein
MFGAAPTMETGGASTAKQQLNNGHTTLMRIIGAPKRGLPTLAEFGRGPT